MGQMPEPASSRHQQAATASFGVPRRRRRLQLRKQRSRLYKAFHAVPDYLQDNEFIKSGYRSEYNGWESLRSLFGLHNETINIWTHLIGFVLFIVLTVLTVRSTPVPLANASDALVSLEAQLVSFGQSSWDTLASLRPRKLQARLMEAGREGVGDLEGRMWGIGQTAWREVSALPGSGLQGYRHLETRAMRAAAALLEITWPVKRWPVYVFTAGAMVCLLTSSVCHLFGCCAMHVAKVVWRFDYAGIAILIVASFFPPVYYGFMCFPVWRAFYLITTSVLGLGAVAVSLMDAFQGPEFRPWRAAMFAGLGLFGVIPVLHGWALHIDFMEVHRALALDLLMGVVYLIGAGLYACRVPECWFPGKFDFAFHSHQLFHVAVVVAACLHYRAVGYMLSWRDAMGGCLGDPRLAAQAVHATVGNGTLVPR